MMEIGFRAVTWAASIATFVGLLLTTRPSGAFAWFFAGLLTMALIVLLCWDIWFCLKRLPRRFPPDSPKIVSYMKHWIANGGRVAIFTRDMSWAKKSPEIRQVLLQKASNQELTICLPQRIALADELEQAGAQVIVYDRIQFIPKSRFTIVNVGRTGQRVAVGRLFEHHHVIEEFSEGLDPAFELANDLFNFIAALPRSSRSRESGKSADAD